MFVTCNNKFLLFSLIFLIHTSGAVFGKRRVPGIIITERDTIHVTFLIPSGVFGVRYISLQDKIKYMDSNGEKHKKRADGIKEIQFQFDDEKVRMVSRPIDFFGDAVVPLSGYKKMFAKIVIEGPTNLYVSYQRRSNYNGTGSVVALYYMERPDGQLMCPPFFKFQKHMMEYFYMCPSLVQEIKNEQFGRQDIVKMVDYYNSHCK